jgi:glycosyltransferase involved in cell wall biosynthesis
LIITSEFPPNVGGIGNHAYNLAKSLAERSYNVTVICDVLNVDDASLDELSHNTAFRIVWIKRSYFLLNTYLQRLLKAKIFSAAAQTIICSGKFPLWLSIMIRAFQKNKQLIAVVHGSELDLKSNIAKQLTNKALSKFDKVISVSNYTQSFLPGTLKETIKKFVIPNGINAIDFKVDLTEVPLQGNPSLITIGSVTERKGQQNAIKALPEIIKQFPDVHYHIVGKPVDQQKLLMLAKDLEVENYITFYGALPRIQLTQKLASAEIKLMLSTHTANGEFEGFGIAVLEANVLGVPVIGSRNSGIADAIVNRKTGILVNPKNAQEIIDAIEEIQSDYAFYSANAKAWATRHDWSNIVERYIEAIEH